MANPLKVKIGIAVFAVFILILIPILETNFFTPITIKRWSKLSWDDFKGIPQLFSSYEASISSTIYIDYDSSRQRYYAYAGQNNIRSWAKRSREEQDYELNHEQYHFNITELHARKLNEYIKQNPEGSLNLFMLRLNSLRLDLNSMQDMYDTETNHSLNHDNQRRWEYKIDSLMTLGKGWITDHFSGAQVYFPHIPDSSKGFAGVSGYRGYVLNKYGTQLALYSYHMGKVNHKTLVTNTYSFESNSGRLLKSITIDSATYEFDALVMSHDTTGFTYYTRWVYQKPYMYKLYSYYRNDAGDTTGYSQNALSFINSFRVINTDDYWIQKLKAYNAPILNSTLSKIEKPEKKSNNTDCLQVGEPKTIGFYRGPFYRDDGAMYLAFDNLVHADSLHRQDLLMMNNDIYVHRPEHESQVYFLPSNKIPQQDFNIRFGYTLKQDSLRQCYEFYHEKLNVTPL